MQYDVSVRRIVWKFIGVVLVVVILIVCRVSQVRAGSCCSTSPDCDDICKDIPACTAACEGAGANCSPKGHCAFSVNNDCTNWCDPGPCVDGYQGQFCCDTNPARPYDYQLIACGETPPPEPGAPVNCHDVGISGARDGSGNLLIGSTYTISATYYDVGQYDSRHMMSIRKGVFACPGGTQTWYDEFDQNPGPSYTHDCHCDASGENCKTCYNSWVDWRCTSFETLPCTEANPKQGTPPYTLNTFKAWTPSQAGTYTIYCSNSDVATASCVSYCADVNTRCTGPNSHITVNVVSPSCTLNLAPATATVTIGGTKLLTAAVTPIGGIISKVDFSPNNGNVSVSPLTDTSSPYKTTATGVSGGFSTVVTATATMSGGQTCADTSTVTVTGTVVIGPWWQVKDGDVTTNGDLRSIVPNTAGLYFGVVLPVLPPKILKAVN